MTYKYKILVAYASEFGTTGEVAEVIGEILCQEGNTVESKWINNVKNLNNYGSLSFCGVSARSIQ